MQLWNELSNLLKNNVQGNVDVVIEVVLFKYKMSEDSQKLNLQQKLDEIQPLEIMKSPNNGVK